MLALALLVAGGGIVDPADDVVAPAPAAANVVARVRMKSVNGVESRALGPVWPLDDVVLSADDSSASTGAIAHYTWSLLSKPAGSTVALVHGDNADAAFQYDGDGGRRIAGLDKAGAYRVRVAIEADDGESSSHEYEVTVAFPADDSRDEPAPRTATPSAPNAPNAKVPAPDKPTATAVRGAETTGATIGCCAGMGLAAGCATLGVAAGTGGLGAVIIPCAAFGCGPCSTGGAVIGAVAGGNESQQKLTELSPWILAGTGAEVLGVLVVSGAYLGTQYANQIAAANTPGAAPDPVIGYVVGAGAIVGTALIALGGPVTVVAAWASAPESR